MIDARSLMASDPIGLSVIVGASAFLDLVLFNLVQKEHWRGLTGIGPINETWKICFELLHSPS